MGDIKKLEMQLEAPIMERVFVNTKPTQEEGQDTIMKEYIVGGPYVDSDVRMILDVATLEYLLDNARRSPTRRVVINRAGIRIKVRRATTGHVYETLHIDGHRPYPEQAPSKFSIPHNPLLGNSLLQHRK